jgi:hypothetical protein
MGAVRGRRCREETPFSPCVLGSRGAALVPNPTDRTKRRDSFLGFSCPPSSECVHSVPSRRDEAARIVGVLLRRVPLVRRVATDLPAAAAGVILFPFLIGKRFGRLSLVSWF